MTSITDIEDRKLLDVIQIKVNENNIHLGIAIAEDKNSVTFVIRSRDKEQDKQVFTIPSKDIEYIVNLLRGQVIGRITEQAMTIIGCLEQYKHILLDTGNQLTMKHISVDANRVQKWLSLNSNEKHVLNIDGINLIHAMSVISRIVCLDNEMNNER